MSDWKKDNTVIVENFNDEILKSSLGGIIIDLLIDLGILDIKILQKKNKWKIKIKEII